MRENLQSASTVIVNLSLINPIIKPISECLPNALKIMNVHHIIAIKENARLVSINPVLIMVLFAMNTQEFACNALMIQNAVIHSLSVTIIHAQLVRFLIVLPYIAMPQVRNAFSALLTQNVLKLLGFHFVTQIFVHLALKKIVKLKSNVTLSLEIV